MTATHRASLPWPHLPIEVRSVELFPQMKNKLLLSLGQFCEHGYKVHLNKETIHINHLTDPSLSLTGQRSSTDGMWYIDLCSHGMANNVHELKKKKDLVTYLHKAAFSPVPITWTKAIDAGYFTIWPGLSSKLVKKHLDKPFATSQGHMKQVYQNIQSTKSTSNNADVEMTMSDNIRTNTAGTKVVEITGRLYTDQTGRFPVTSSRGNKYVMVLYHYDTNAILAKALKSRAEQELVNAQEYLHKYLKARGFQPEVQILDNECPEGLKNYFRTNNIQFQLVPPNLHRNNLAEKAIGTFNDHLIAGLSSADPDFPMHLWC